MIFLKNGNWVRFAKIKRADILSSDINPYGFVERKCLQQLL
jgi:hypothetical protein